MDWNAIGAVGELLGSVGVLITLVYLAVQIRQNTDSLAENRKYAKAQMYQARADAVNYMTAELNDPTVMAKLVGTDGIDFDKIGELTTEEALILRNFAQALDTHCDNIFQQRLLGLLDATDDDLMTEETLRFVYEISRRVNIELRPSTTQAIVERGIDS
jgi:hypothetical protein